MLIFEELFIRLSQDFAPFYLIYVIYKLKEVININDKRKITRANMIKKLYNFKVIGFLDIHLRYIKSFI